MQKKLSEYEIKDKIKEIRSYICSDFCKSVSEAKECYKKIADYEKLLKEIK